MKKLTSPLIDFHISKNKLSWFVHTKRGITFHILNQGLHGPVILRNTQNQYLRYRPLLYSCFSIQGNLEARHLKDGLVHKVATTLVTDVRVFCWYSEEFLSSFTGYKSYSIQGNLEERHLKDCLVHKVTTTLVADVRVFLLIIWWVSQYLNRSHKLYT